MAKQERIVFELVEDGGGALPDDGRGTHESGGPIDAWPRFAARVLRTRSWVARHRVTSLVATATAAALVFTLAGLGVAWERDRIERLRAAPGGVVSLAGPVHEAWRYEPEGEIALQSTWWGTELEAVAVGENLVFLEGDREAPKPANAFDGGQGTWSAADLVAVNTETGEMAWRVPLGVDPVCDVLGLTDGGYAQGLPQVDSVTCVFGGLDQREAVVVGAGGALSEPRELPAKDAVRHGQAMPISGGLLVRPHFEGEEPEVTCSESGGCTAPTAAPDRRAVIRVEDARSGEVRWTRAVEWSGDMTSCSTPYGGDVVEVEDDGVVIATDSSDSTDVHTIHISAYTDRSFSVAGCGVDAILMHDGTSPMPVPVPFGDAGRTKESNPDEEGPRITVRSADGEDLFSTSGSPTEFTATDGTPSDIVMVRENDNTIQGYGTDGSTMWPPEAAIDRDVVLVRADENIVFVEGAGETTAARNIHTGRELWTANLWPEAGRPLVYGGNRAVFTDGSIVLIVLMENPEQDPFGTDSTRAAEPARLVAVDADDGRIVWRAQRRADTWFAVNGRLFSVTDTGTIVGHRTS